MRSTGVDVSVFSLGGTSFLGDLKSAVLTADADLVDGTAIVSEGLRPVVSKRSASLTCELSSPGGIGGVVTGLDLSSLEMGIVEHVGLVRRLRFDGAIVHAEGSGVADEWTHPVPVRKAYRMKVELAADSGGPFGGALASFGSIAGMSFGVGLNLNGVDVGLPMVVRSFEHSLSAGELQTWVLELEGQAPVSGSYPVAPVGTGSLLAAAFQAPGAALSMEIASRAVGGLGYSGAFVVKEFGFGVRSGEVVSTRYMFSSVGAVSAGVTD